MALPVEGGNICPMFTFYTQGSLSIPKPRWLLPQRRKSLRYRVVFDLLARRLGTPCRQDIWWRKGCVSLLQIECSRSYFHRENILHRSWYLRLEAILSTCQPRWWDCRTQYFGRYEHCRCRSLWRNRIFAASLLAPCATKALSMEFTCSIAILVVTLASCRTHQGFLYNNNYLVARNRNHRQEYVPWTYILHIWIHQ